MMEYLINMYGQIKREDLCTLKSKIEDHIYDPILPIDVLFNKVDFFSDLSEFTNKSLPDTEKVDIVYIVLNCCGVFQTSLLRLNQLPIISQTYNAMKSIFRKEHADLIKSRLKVNLVEAIGNFAAAYEEDSATINNADTKENIPTDLNSALTTITGNLNK